MPLSKVRIKNIRDVQGGVRVKVRVKPSRRHLAEGDGSGTGDADYVSGVDFQVDIVVDDPEAALIAREAANSEHTTAVVASFAAYLMEASIAVPEFLEVEQVEVPYTAPGSEDADGDCEQSGVFASAKCFVARASLVVRIGAGAGLLLLVLATVTLSRRRQRRKKLVKIQQLRKLAADEQRTEANASRGASFRLKPAPLERGWSTFGGTPGDPVTGSVSGVFSSQGVRHGGLSRQESGRFGVHRPNALPESKSFRWGARNPAWASARNLLGSMGKSKRGLSIADEAPATNPVHEAAASSSEKNPLSRHRSGMKPLAPITSGRARDDDGAGAPANAPAPAASMVSHTPLPLGWFENFDESGRHYYYNECGDVSWVRPTVSIV